MTRLRVGTRGSPLALTQAELAVSRLRDAARSAGLALDTQLVAISTSGDAQPDRPFREIGNKGIFTSELQRALADGHVDVAVHSAKDLTGAHPDGLVLAAYLERADVRDVVVGAALDALPAGSTVGTSSVRRRAQLAAVRPDLRTAELRGNVGTRVRKVLAGEVDAAILAAAGLMRAGLQDEIVQWLDPASFCPAAGQGAIAIEARADRMASDLSWVAGADHAPTREAVTAERVVVNEMEADCTVPLGVWARADDDALSVDAFVAASGAGPWVSASVRGVHGEPEAAGAAMVAELLERGAGEIVRLGRSSR